MGMSNAERQRLFIQRLKERAAAGQPPKPEAAKPEAAKPGQSERERELEAEVTRLRKLVADLERGKTRDVD